MANRKIAIVGAGAAGLTGARHAMAAGHDVTVFEIGTQVGGLWTYQNDNGRSSAYRSLHINTARRFTHFTDLDFRETPSLFPSHWDISLYLNYYADHFDIRCRIRFTATVTSVSPELSHAGSTGVAWRVQASDGTDELFDAVIVASGHLADPVLPPFAERFGGDALHAHYYKEPWDYRGKRILVVGTGNSGMDIAGDLATVADRTVISSRSPVLITPKLFFGRPLGDVERWFKKWWLPGDAHLVVRRLATRLVHGRMEQWGFETPKGRTHPISHATLINHIAYRRAHVSPGVVDVDGKTVIFSDGSREDFDAMVLATGYEIKFPFLDPAIVSTDEGGSLNLYGRAVPPTWPGLYFLGYFNVNGLSNPRMFEYQARWFAAVEAGEVVLPGLEEMRKDIEGLKATLAKRYPPGPRYALELEPPPYLKFLARERRAHHRRRSGSELSNEEMLRYRAVEPRLGGSAPVQMAQSVRFISDQ